MRKICFRMMGILVTMAALAGIFGCQPVLKEVCPLPPEINAPEAAVAVFYTPESDALTVYGDSTLAERRYIPCSTFKIVSTLMGLDAGVISGKEARLGYDGTRHEIAAWNADVTLEEAFRASCVWYYKKMIGRLSRSYVQETLDRLDYGNCDISVWNSNGHNVFWIESSLLISLVEQLGVLEKIFSGRSGFRPEHVAMLKDCMSYGTVGTLSWYGKTGTGRNHITNRLEAWFVGFAERENGERIYFAMHVADPERNVASSEVREMLRLLLSASPE